jgi:hypothetical protein
MPKVKDNYYDDAEQPRYNASERQDFDVVRGILGDVDAYNEYILQGKSSWIE